MTLACKHESYQACCNYGCEFYTDTPWVCFYRYHGVDALYAMPRHRTFLDKLLSVEKGNCPLDDGSIVMEQCYVHDKIRGNGAANTTPTDYFCDCDINILMGAGCQCGGS